MEGKLVEKVVKHAKSFKQFQPDPTQGLSSENGIQKLNLTSPEDNVRNEAEKQPVSRDSLVTDVEEQYTKLVDEEVNSCKAESNLDESVKVQIEAEIQTIKPDPDSDVEQSTKLSQFKKKDQDFRPVVEELSKKLDIVMKKSSFSPELSNKLNNMKAENSSVVREDSNLDTISVEKSEEASDTSTGKSNSERSGKPEEREYSSGNEPETANLSHIQADDDQLSKKLSDSKKKDSFMKKFRKLFSFC
eukprot:NODE_101_length_19951_cov_0.932501.p9 type:complete len:246 gc:universal NODE_101_length_19951_cov_0.932501:12577-13314(+)